MYDIFIGNKRVNNVRSVSFPSANDETFNRTFTLTNVVYDMFRITDIVVTVSMEEQSDGSCIVYMDTDITQYGGSEPKPISGLNSWYVLIDENPEFNDTGKSINGYFVHSLGGKPYYSAAEDFGYSYTSQRNAGFHKGSYSGTLYNSEWGSVAGKYSMLKYSSSEYTKMKNSGDNFGQKQMRLVSMRYPIANLEPTLGDTSFNYGGEVVVNE